MRGGIRHNDVTDRVLQDRNAELVRQNDLLQREVHRLRDYIDDREYEEQLTDDFERSLAAAGPVTVRKGLSRLTLEALGMTALGDHHERIERAVDARMERV